MNLPAEPRRSELRAFTLLLSAMLGVFLGVGGLTAFGLIGLAAGAAVTFTLAVSMHGHGRLARAAYRTWNAVADVVAFLARQVLMIACYGVVAAARLAGGRLSWRSPGRSGWVRREAGAAPTFADAGARALVIWALRTGNSWVLALAPYLLALRMVRGPTRGSLSQDVYTLY